jgi:hypothetical protein
MCFYKREVGCVNEFLERLCSWLISYELWTKLLCHRVIVVITCRSCEAVQAVK